MQPERQPPSHETSAVASGLVLGVLGAGVVALLCIVWARLAPESLHVICREDGPIESATALAFLVAAIGFMLAARGLGGSGLPAPTRRLAQAFLIAGSLLMLVFCGEELSWGQRIFGFVTPEPLKTINQQGEFNVHNVARLQRMKYTLLVATVALVGIGLPSLRLLAPTRRLVARFGLPLPPAACVGLFVAALFFLRHAANWLDLIERNDPQEVGEFLFALGMAGFGLTAAVRASAVILSTPSVAAAAAAPVAAPAAVPATVPAAGPLRPAEPPPSRLPALAAKRVERRVPESTEAPRD